MKDSYTIKRITRQPPKLNECRQLYYDRFGSVYRCELNHGVCPFPDPFNCFRYLEMKRSDLRAEQENK